MNHVNSTNDLKLKFTLKIKQRFYCKIFPFDTLELVLKIGKGLLYSILSLPYFGDQ